MDPVIAILNKVIEENLPAINRKIDTEIINRNLDPMKYVISGEDTLGRINLGLCTASVKAGYDIKDLIGLSSFTITSLKMLDPSAQAIADSGGKEIGGGELTGDVWVEALLKSSMTAGVGGNVKAGCGIIKKKTGISGKVTATSVTVSGGGTFHAGVNGENICLEQLYFDQLHVDYGKLTVHINGLGFFNLFLAPLKNLILSLFKGQIRSALSGALTSILNDQFNSSLPMCGDEN
jgi:hypothetical protein